MSEPESASWAPVEIPPHGPSIAVALHHHRHNSGAACSACYIVSLRNDLATLQQRVEAAERENESLRLYPQKLLDTRADLGRAVEALKQYEWAGQGGIIISEKDEDYCLACTNFKSGGHKTDCWFVDALSHLTPTTPGPAGEAP